MDTDRRIIYLNPRDLLPSRHNVRSNPGDLAGLAETIREHGILQPLGVASEADGYRVVYGNRRRDAAIVVGLDRVPCMVIEATDDDEVALQQILENLQRLDLNDLDKSRAFERFSQRLSEQGLGARAAYEMMARTLGLSARQIQRYVRLRQLSPKVQRLVAQGELGVTHGQHLVDLTPASRQEAVALLAVEENLSTAELSRLCSALKHNGNIEPAVALGLLRSGQRIPTIETRPRETLSRLTATPIAEGSASDKGEKEEGAGGETSAQIPPWEQGGLGQSSGQLAERDDMAHYGSLEPTTRDGNRVHKIHSLDAFMDELQRLTLCIQEGDLQRLINESQGARVKARLAARQLRFLADALEAIAQSLGAA